MADAAQRAGVVCQVGFNYRHTPAITVIKQQLDAGRLGTPVQFRASYLQDALFYVNAPAYGWRRQKSTGGSGSSGDIGSHVIDLAEYLCGEIVRVSGCLRSRNADWSKGWQPEADRLAGDLPDESGVWLAEFANGAIGTFSVSLASYGHKNRITFEMDCTKGAAEFNWNRREEIRLAYADEPLDSSGFHTVIVSDVHPDVWYPVAGLGFGYVDGSAVQMRKYLDAVISGTPPHPDFAEAAHVQQVVEALAESARTGSWVHVPSRVPASQ